MKRLQEQTSQRQAVEAARAPGVKQAEIDALKAESDRCEKHLNEMISNVSEAIPKRS